MVENAVRQPPQLPQVDWLRALPPAVRFAFFGGAAARAAAAGVWGAAFSEVPLRANRFATYSTLWLGPDEYLLLDQRESQVESGWQAQFEVALRDIPHALVDVSHRQFAFEVLGPHAAAILNGACPLDLDLGAFPVGMCTRTVLAKADIVLWRTEETTFHVEAWRSFAGYVSGCLSEIAAEFHPPSIQSA